MLHDNTSSWMRPEKIILSASAVPVPAECLCYRQGPCCQLCSRAKVATHLVAQVEGISVSKSNKMTRTPWLQELEQSSWQSASHGARCSGAGRTLCWGCQHSAHLWCLPRASGCPWQGAFWLGSAPELSPSPCGTAWVTDVAALPRGNNHPLAAFLLPTKCTAGNMKAQSV